MDEVTSLHNTVELDTYKYLGNLDGVLLVYRFLPVWYKLGSALPMFPKSEDNYEMSAHSILVLTCSPPVVVISTMSGTCYHCILLPLEDHVSLL